MLKLSFHDGEEIKTDILGSIAVDGKRYAYFYDEKQKYIYIYGYKLKQNKATLREITDPNEFEKACDAFDRRIGVKK